MEKRMQDIIALKNRSYFIYDEMCSNLATSCEALKAVKEMQDTLSSLLQQEIEENNFKQIIALEDFVIEPGESKFINTNIAELFPNLTTLDFSSDAFIPSYGFLTTELVYFDDQGCYKIKVTNNIEKNLFVENILGTYYGDPTKTMYNGTGTYLIKAGSPIGIAGINKQNENNILNLETAETRTRKIG